MGIEDLLSAISQILKANKREVTLLIPYASAGMLNTLCGECPILGSPNYRDDGIEVKTILDERNYSRFSNFILEQKEE